MNIAAVGDVHGHLALMYGVLGRWQNESGRRIDLILQLGDLGAFLPGSQLDQATKKFSQRDPEELGFAEFAGPAPPPTLLDPRPPLVFIPGNHEDFHYLEECERSAASAEVTYPVSQDRKIQAMRSGRIFNFSSGGDCVRVGGVGGVDNRPAKKGKHPRLHLREEDALGLAESGPGAFDILISHDCPYGLWSHNGEVAGSPSLRLLIEEVRPPLAFFAHYDRVGEWKIGATEVFGMGGCKYLPWGDWPLSPDGIAIVRWERGSPLVERLRPAWLQQSTRYNWRHWGRPAAR